MISYFSKKTEFDISCEFSSLEIIYIQCLMLVSDKNAINLSSVDFAWIVIMVNDGQLTNKNQTMHYVS